MNAPTKSTSINVKRALNKALQNPRKTYTKDDFRNGLRQNTSYSRIEEAVNYLRDEKIFKNSTGVGAPPKKPRTRIFFQLSPTMTTLKKIVQIYWDTKEIDKLLKSEKYWDYVIGKQSFLSVHNKVINPRLENSDFRRIASYSLLDHPAVIGEYDEIAKKLNDDILRNCMDGMSRTPDCENNISLHDMLHETGNELGANHIEHIDILNNYDPLMAVRLYRKTLHKSILNAYDELATKAVISEGLRRFLVFDNYLSPLTSYPVNGTLRILFSQPFERIYEDAYLLDGERFELLSSRAATIYCDFPDIIFELFRTSKLSSEELKTFTMRMIYHWNLASTVFDLVCIQLSDLYDRKVGSGNYHLKSDGLEFNIIDIQNGEKLLESNISKSILMVGSCPSVFKHTSDGKLRMENMKNPFTCLRPCLTFSEFGWKSDYVPIEDILSQLMSRN